MEFASEEMGTAYCCRVAFLIDSELFLTQKRVLGFDDIMWVILKFDETPELQRTD